MVLRRYKLGEADRIVVFLSQHHGQIRAVVKGARKTTSRFGGRLEPFSVVDAQFYRGRGDLDTITQAETIHALSAPLSRDYEMFTLAQVMVDIAEKLSAQDIDSPAHYRLLYGALGAMAQRQHAPSEIFVSYLLRALLIAGWPPRLDQCGTCHAYQSAQLIPAPPSRPEAAHTKILSFLSIAGGGAYCESCRPPDARPIDPAQLAALYWLMQGNWVRAADVQLAPSSVDSMIRYAQWHVEHTMKSLSVLAQGVS